MKFSNQFADFVNSGRRPTSDREASALLDEARSVISNIVDRIESGQLKLAGPQAIASKPTASAPVKHAPKASAPIPAPTPKAATTITAQQFAKPIVTMERAEFAKLTNTDKSRFCQEGGRLI